MVILVPYTFSPMKRHIDMGIDDLSVSPSFVLPIRKIIREI